MTGADALGPGPSSARVVGPERLGDAAQFLSGLLPALPTEGWQRRLEACHGDRGVILGIDEGRHLYAIAAIRRADYAWNGAWYPAAHIVGLAAVPGPHAGRRIQSLVFAAEAWSRQAGCVLMLTEPAPWTPSAAFVAQAAMPYWQLAPEHLRRYRQAKPMRPIVAGDRPALAALFERRAQGMAGTLRRDVTAWQDLFNSLAPAGPYHGFMTDDGSAYVLLHGGHPSANTIVVPVVEWLDDGRDGLASVVTFLAHLQGRARQLTLPVPPDRPIGALLVSAAPIQAHHWLGPCLRLVDPDAFLRPLFPEASLDTRDGGSTLILPEGTIVIPTRTLSALVGGSLDPESAWHLRDLSGDADASSAFSRRWPQARHFRFATPGSLQP